MPNLGIEIKHIEKTTVFSSQNPRKRAFSLKDLNRTFFSKDPKVKIFSAFFLTIKRIYLFISVCTGYFSLNNIVKRKLYPDFSRTLNCISRVFDFTHSFHICSFPVSIFISFKLKDDCIKWIYKFQLKLISNLTLNCIK